MKGKPVAEQEIGKQLLLETVGYAETSVCRRRVLLNYFGERYDQDNCGNCDNCLHPKPQIEAQDELELLIEAILAVKEKHQAEHIVNVLLGKTDQQVKTYKHDKLELFGDGGDQSERFWTTLIRQAVLSGLLHKDIDNYGLLKVSESGHDYLKTPTSFKNRTRYQLR